MRTGCPCGYIPEIYSKILICSFIFYNFHQPRLFAKRSPFTKGDFEKGSFHQPLLITTCDFLLIFHPPLFDSKGDFEKCSFQQSFLIIKGDFEKG